MENRDVFLGDDISSLGAADDRSKSLQELYVWTKQVSRLLTNLTERINNTNRAWESFKARDFHYFHEINQKDPRSRHVLHPIDMTFTELETLQVRLGNLTNKHEDFRKSVSFAFNTKFLVRYRCEGSMLTSASLSSACKLKTTVPLFCNSSISTWYMNPRGQRYNKKLTDIWLDPNHLAACSSGIHNAVRHLALEVWFLAMASHHGSVMDFDGGCAACIDMVPSTHGPEAKASTSSAACGRFDA